MPTSRTTVEVSPRASAPGGEAPAYGRDAQRQVASAWERVAADAASAGPVASPRAPIAASWRRAVAAGLPADLPHAPRVLDDDALVDARLATSWLELADDVVRRDRADFVGAAHVLALFDAAGRMLHADGDPAALEALTAINFAPGASWAEATTGTNGPGTALASGHAVHVVGAEHYCAAWQHWHCAAAPVRDPVTGRVLGVVDLSGPADRATPHALALASALAVAIEQRLVARQAEDHARVLTSWAEMSARYPRQGVIAVSPDGRVLARSRADLPGTVHVGGRAEETARLLAAILAGDGTDAPFDVAHPLLGGGIAGAHPVVRDGRALATCVVLPVSPSVSARSAMPASAAESAPREARARGGRGTPPPPSGGGARYRLDDLIGTSAAMHAVRRMARGCARTDLPVLLLGESGTGKEVLAQGIHRAGPRADGPFVAVNCGALPRELVVSELFGYAGGAFSGARREGARGKFDAAHGGTLFLDEIGELPPDAQAALLRALQEGEVTPVGEAHGHAVDVRVIAATNRDLEHAIGEGRFRDDLYHRLAVLTVSLPPLRERPEDVAPLLAHFLAMENATHAVPRRFAPSLVTQATAYRWPGNVRELRNVVRRVVALSEAPEIGVEELPPRLRSAGVAGHPTDHGATADSAVRDDAERIVAIGDAHGALDERARARRPSAGVEPSFVVGDAAAAIAAEVIATDATDAHSDLAALVARHATMTDAAAELGVTRSTLYRRLARAGLAPARGVTRRR